MGKLPVSAGMRGFVEYALYQGDAIWVNFRAWRVTDSFRVPPHLTTPLFQSLKNTLIREAHD